MSGSVIKQPRTSIAIANASVAVQNSAHKCLFVGQKTAAGSATAGALVTNVGNEGEEDALFGPSSQLASAIRAFRRINEVSRVDAIALDDSGSGVPRVIDFTIGGTPTAAGTVTVVAGSERDHSYDIPVLTTDTPTTIAAAIVAAITADTKCPFSAGNVAGAVTLTAENDGTLANMLGVEVDISDAAGVTLAVAVTETTPGSVDPTLTSVLDVATLRYQGVNWPYSAVTVLTAWLDPRFNADNAVLDGVAFIPLVDTLANLTDGSSGYLDLLNNQNLVVFCDQAESESGYLGPAQNEAGWKKTAYFMAIRALRLTEDQSISLYVVTSASRDQFGGVALASLPYSNTPISFLPLIASGRGWSDTDIETLFDAGGSVMGVNIAGNTGLVGEVVTTYKTDAASNPDPTFEFLNYVDTEVAIREYRFNNAKARFAQSRLTQGAVARNRDMANEATIRAFFEKLYKDTSGDDMVLTQAGDEAEAFYKANLDVTLDLDSGTVTATDLTPIVTQFRNLIMTMKVTFSVGS